MSNPRPILTITTALAAATLLAGAAGAQTTVTSFAPSSNTDPKVWFENDVREDGMALLADLTGLGGDLETNQPLPVGAALLTTTANLPDKAEVGVIDAYGKVSDIFSTLSISYAYHKASNPGQNASAAPSLKLAFLETVCDDGASAGDCFGTLVYEPTWNQPGFEGSSSVVPTDTWTTVTVDEDNGLFWWTGGFGQPNTAGGPPLRTLAQWRTVFSSDFEDAELVLVSIGVGTYNNDQVGYFDDVSITHGFGGGYAESYDFQPPPPEFIGTDVAVGVAPCDVIAKDLSGDGVADIATADSGSDSVTVLTNDGSGGFGSSTTVPLAPGSSPSALAAGELVAGGGCDLAVALRDADAVAIVDNAPDGTFTVSATLSTLPATEPVGVAVGDIDGVGTDDVVAAMQGDLLIAGNGAVAVSLNGGAFVALTPPVGGFLRPQSVLLCDLDGDGDGDVVATMMGTAFAPTVTDNVLLYENVGGAFGAPIALGVSQNPKGLCCVDIDDDGDEDLAVTAESFPTILPGSVEVFVNDTLAPGTWSPSDFSAGGSFAGGTSPSDLACGDLRDDSIPGFCAMLDIVAVNFGSENVTRFDSYDSGAFAAQSTETAGTVPVAIAIAEFDGDKTPDMVVANKASDDVTVLLAVTPSLTKPFGVGCAGSTGVPQIEAVGVPFFDNPAFGVRLTGARPFAPTLLGLSLTQATTDLGAGCSLYLLPPLVLLGTVTDAGGATTVTLPIPSAGSSFAGCDAFFQYFVFDPNGSLDGQFAFSEALRIKVGN
ncbi:MAG: FG-GAP repeat domain-containing protein [Planctomycetota bacterium JB042]